MAISDHQIRSVIRSYVRIMKVKLIKSEEDYSQLIDEDQIEISSEAIKRMMHDRIEQHIAEKLKRDGSTPWGTAT